MLINSEQLHFDLTPAQVAELVPIDASRADTVWIMLLEQLAEADTIALQSSLVERLYKLMQLAEAE